MDDIVFGILEGHEGESGKKLCFENMHVDASTKGRKQLLQDLRYHGAMDSCCSLQVNRDSDAPDFFPH